ncbi:MAG: sulfatase [Planctomycetota bacterium]
MLPTLAAALAGVTALGCGGSSGDEPRAPVVLIVIDTLRADGLGCYGAGAEAAPAITRLGAEGAIFRQVLAASPWTGPSVASILTGKYPDEVGIHGLRDPLPIAAATLAERFQAAGFRTGAVVSNPLAGSAYGYDRGYEHFHLGRYKGEPGGSGRPFFTADRVTDAALAWLAEIAPDPAPFFLHVHYTDPHEPYLAPARWRDAALAGGAPLAEELLLDGAFTRAPLTASQLQTLERSYAAEVAFVDHEVGRLLAALPPDALVVFTSDHGEEFREHGGFLHGHSLFQELLHVPLIVRGPGVPAGVVVEAPVSQVDIAPTIVELARLGRRRADFAGTSLVPLLQRAAAPGEEDARPHFSVLENKGHRVYAVRQGRWKLHYEPDQRQSILYDLEADPGERRNLAREQGDLVSSLVELLRKREARILPADTPKDPELLRRLEEELRAIGYAR